MKKTFAGIAFTLVFASCSVQQFGVNTTVQPFDSGGKVFGEQTKGKKFIKGGDLHVFGLNVKSSDTNKMSAELNAQSYTIETKSNLWVSFLSFGLVDYKTVKVIKR